jgi:ATP-binding cassette subfamily F protein 3
MRALMGRMLLSGAEVLLLDEPTNHLDLDALAWLEAQLGRTPAAVIVVSHDRVFLDRVVNRIAHLSRERIRIWPGNYSAWSARRAAERAADGERERKLAAEETRLQEFVDRFRYKATKAAQAQERLKLLEGVQAERAAITLEHDRSWRLALAEPPASGDPVVQLHGVEKRFGDKCVLHGVDLTLRRGERLAVMGANGAGKTTLLRLIGGELFPERGRRLLGSGVTIGRFAQHQLEAMEPDRTVLEEALATAPGKRPEQVRQALGALGIGNVHVERRIRSLSGGERARVALARLVLNPSVVLLLDEPTNHLDLTMREALESGLAAWPGTLLVVSHDRAFLSAVTHGTLAVEAGLVERIAPGWESFLAWRASRRAAAPSAASDQAAGGASAANEREARRQRAEAVQQRSRRLRPLKAELDQVERQIHDDEARQRTIDDQFADPAVSSDGERMRALVAERAAISTRLPTLYSRWEQLSVEIESLSGPA